MRHVRSWRERCASGLAALSVLMLTHCGDSRYEEAQALEAPASQAPGRREQELVTTLTFAATAVSSGSWVEYDVTSAVSGSGELNLALIATSSDGTDFASRESSQATRRPQLVVTFSPADCMPRRERYTELWFAADAYVSQDSPSSNFDRDPVMQVEGGDGVDFVSRDTSDVTSYPRLRLTVETPPYCSYRGTGGGLTGWARQIGGVGGERLQALATDSAGGFVAAGLFGDAVFPEEGEGFALARYAADGAFLWSRVLATDDVKVRSLTVTPRGNIFVVGSYEGSPDLGTGPLPPVPEGGIEQPGLFFAKFSPSGALLWLRSFTAGSTSFGPGLITPSEVATDAEGSLILTGSFRGTLDLGGGPLPPGDFTPSGFLARFSWDGRHLWSRGFTTDREGRTSFMSTVATDAAGNILLGGPASPGADLGGGPLSTDGAFFAKYTPTGSLLWVRIFSGSHLANRAVSVRAVDASTVAFAAYLGGTFTFGGNTYTGGDPESPDSSSVFVGTLSATGTDGWLRSLGRIAVNPPLATGPGGTITLSGQASNVFDLGGGTLGHERLILLSPFVARYSSLGSHLWSRVFDPNLILPFLGQQPDGAVVVGAISMGPVDLEGRLFTPSGPSDLFYLQLRP